MVVGPVSLLHGRDDSEGMDAGSNAVAVHGPCSEAEEVVDICNRHEVEDGMDGEEAFPCRNRLLSSQEEVGDAGGERRKDAPYTVREGEVDSAYRPCVGGDDGA